MDQINHPVRQSQILNTGFYPVSHIVASYKKMKFVGHKNFINVINLVSLTSTIIAFLACSCLADFKFNNNHKITVCEDIPGRDNHTSYWYVDAYCVFCARVGCVVRI